MYTYMRVRERERERARERERERECLSYLPADAAYVVLLQLPREGHLLQHLNIASLKEKLARVSPTSKESSV